MIRNRMRLPVIGLLAMLAFLQVGAQEKKPTLWKRITSNKHLTRIDSVLSARYFRMGKMDTAYITRPQTKWTVVARVNVSGAKINAEGLENGHPFKAEMKANYKSTLSLGLSYLGLSLSASITSSFVTPCLMTIKMVSSPAIVPNISLIWLLSILYAILLA